MQDVFLRAYGALRADDRPVTLRAWLYRVAHNRCIDQLRRPLPAAVDLFDLTRGPSLHDPLEEAERREDLRRLVADVRRLPEQQRSALLMREMEGLTYKELSEALVVSIPAVKSLLVRARIGLVEAIEARDAACERHPRWTSPRPSTGACARAAARDATCATARRVASTGPRCAAGSGSSTAWAAGTGCSRRSRSCSGIGGAGSGAAAGGGAASAGGGAAVIGGGAVATKVAVLACCAAVVGGTVEVQQATQPLKHVTHAAPAGAARVAAIPAAAAVIAHVADPLTAPRHHAAPAERVTRDTAAAPAVTPVATATHRQRTRRSSTSPAAACSPRTRTRPTPRPTRPAARPPRRRRRRLLDRLALLPGHIHHAVRERRSAERARRRPDGLHAADGPGRHHARRDEDPVVDCGASSVTSQPSSTRRCSCAAARARAASRSSRSTPRRAARRSAAAACGTTRTRARRCATRCGSRAR